jgi:hypothetical protein
LLSRRAALRWGARAGNTCFASFALPAALSSFVFIRMCVCVFVFVKYFFFLKISGFNTTAKLFAAVQGALRLEFVVDQGLNFNGFLAAHAKVLRGDWLCASQWPSRHGYPSFAVYLQFR